MQGHDEETRVKFDNTAFGNKDGRASINFNFHTERLIVTSAGERPPSSSRHCPMRPCIKVTAEGRSLRI
jgi:hypothetical protein